MGGGSTGMKGLPARALLFVARGLLSGACALFAFYLFVVATRQWRDDGAWASFPPDFGCDDTTLLDACVAQKIAYLHWLPTIAALTACCLAAASATLSLPPICRLAAQRQLPLGRAFWAKWCGGLSRGDALLAAGVLVINAAWAASLGSRYSKLLKFFEGGGSGTPVWVLETMLASIALGQMLMPNLALLFFPVARGSPLLQALGVSYPSAIRAHRWLGHLTMAIASAHSLGFWGVWLARGQWTAEALAQGARVNNLAGGLSFLGGLALWLTSLENARRARYGLFIATHHAGWWIFFLAGVAHYSPLVWFFLPGLLLYFVDAAFRLSSWGAGVGAGGGNVRAIEVAWETREGEEEDKRGEQEGAATSVVALVVRAPAGFAAADAGIVWVRAPAVSFRQWHPFEYVSVSNGGGADKAGGDGGGDDQDNETAPALLALHIKSYGGWTRAFAAIAREAAVSGRVQGLDLRLEAPYGDEPPAEAHEEEEEGEHEPQAAAGDDEEGGGGAAASSVAASPPIVVLAGGIGATAALSLLRELGREHDKQQQQHKGANHPHPKRQKRPLLLVWAARHAPELAVMLPRLLDAAARAGVDLDARLFYTGRGGLAALGASGWASASALDATAAAPGSSVLSASSPSSCPLMSLKPPPAAAASSQCPVLAPGRLLVQLAQRLSAHALGCLGALTALLAVRQAAVVAPARLGLDGWTTARAGLASAAAIALGAALPALAVVAVARALLSRAGKAAAAAAAGAAGPSNGSLGRPLLFADEGDEGGQGGQGALPLPRVRFVADAASGGAAALVVAAASDKTAVGGAQEEIALPVALGRPLLLRGLVCDWLAAQHQQHQHQHATGAPPGGKAGCKLSSPPPAELFAMGPDALVEEARTFCDDLAGAAAGADGPRPLPAVLFRLRTHEL